MRTCLRTMSPTPPQAVARPLPPLAVAAARGDVTALEALLAEGLDLNTTTPAQPRTCLMEACRSNEDTVVDWLLARGAEVDARDSCGLSALHYACEGDSPMSVLSLVRAGCDVTTPAGPKGRLPIDFASSHQLKHALLTQLLDRIENGQSRNVPVDACVALHCAAAIGDNERARSLIQPAGGSPPPVLVDAADSLGRTALHWACFLSMQNAADFLIGQGADPEFRALPALDAIWGTGIWDARMRRGGTRGAELMPTVDGGMLGPTPFECCHQLHAARILVKGSVDIAMQRRVEDDFVGASARALAAEARVAKEIDRLKEESSVDDVEDLTPDRDLFDVIGVKTGGRGEDRARDGEAGGERARHSQMGCALRLAAASANFGEVIELQGAGADVNAAETGSGLTALHLAGFFGAHDVARSLIAGGADRQALDKFGRSCKSMVPSGSDLISLFD